MAWRNMLRQKGYTLINVLGLSIGLATTTLIVRYIQSEFSVDRWHSKSNRIYRVLRETRSGGESTFRSGTSGALAAAIEQDFPEVEEAVRTFRVGIDVFYEEKASRFGLCIADTTIFRVFDFPFVSGSVETAFPNPSSIAISQSIAYRLFGDDDPIGKTLTLRHRYTTGEYTITAVLKDIPRNTTLRFGAVITSPNVKGPAEVWNGWSGNNAWRPVEVYLLIREGATIDRLRAQISTLIERYMGPEIARNNDYHLQAFRDVYLYSRRDYDMGWSDINRVYQFAAIAAIVLAIACINFTNLATARSARRAGEVGLRKVTGAHRSQLVGQFLGESIVTTLLASALSVVIVKLVIADFNAFFQKQLTLDLMEEPVLAIALLGIAVVVGVVAGAYPALFLSSFQPSETLKGSLRTGSAGHTIRKALVVAQFAISIILLI